MIRTTTCALVLLLPMGLAAQGLTIGPFAATDRGLPGTPALVGLSATAWSGAFGLRAGAAMDAPSSPIAPLLGEPPTPSTGAWSGDLDLLFSGGRAGLSVAGIRPGLLVGFGLHGRRRITGTTATVPVWSYGVTAGFPLHERFSLDAEARYRMPHESDPALLPSGVGGGWDLRLGASLHFGDTGRPPAARRASGSRAPATIRMGSRLPRDPGPAPAPGRAAGLDVVGATLSDADDLVGIPYVWGGESPGDGFDCSGFVQYVYARQGVRLPRVSRDQARAGSPVSPRVDALRPGDLMFYAGSNGVVNHVAMYVGDGRIIHSSSSRGAVAYDRLDSRRGRYYATRMVAARRVVW